MHKRSCFVHFSWLSLGSVFTRVFSKSLLSVYGSSLFLSLNTDAHAHSFTRALYMLYVFLFTCATIIAFMKAYKTYYKFAHFILQKSPSLGPVWMYCKMFRLGKDSLKIWNWNCPHGHLAIPHWHVMRVWNISKPGLGCGLRFILLLNMIIRCC